MTSFMCGIKIYLKSFSSNQARYEWNNLNLWVSTKISWANLRVRIKILLKFLLDNKDLIHEIKFVNV